MDLDEADPAQWEGLPPAEGWDAYPLDDAMDEVLFGPGGEADPGPSGAPAAGRAQGWAAKIKDYHEKVVGAPPTSRKAAAAVGHSATYEHCRSLRKGKAKFSLEEALVLQGLNGWVDCVVPEGSAGRAGYLAVLSGGSSPVRQRKRINRHDGQGWARQIEDYHEKVGGALPNSQKAAAAVGHAATYAHFVNLRNGGASLSAEESVALRRLDGWFDCVVPEGSAGRSKHDAEPSGKAVRTRLEGKVRKRRDGQGWAREIEDYHAKVGGALPNSANAAAAVGHSATYARLANLRGGVAKFSSEEVAVLRGLDGWAESVVPEGSVGRAGYLAALSGGSSPAWKRARGKRYDEQGWARQIADYYEKVGGALPDSRKAAAAVGHSATYARLSNLRNGGSTFSQEEAVVLQGLARWADHVAPEGSAGRTGYLEALSQVPSDAAQGAGSGSASREVSATAQVAAMTSPAMSPPAGTSSTQPAPSVYAGTAPPPSRRPS
ncbi:hypothetical protein ABT336_04515 [Micromonospora sp. NPDC000207]|uniref:hypothetical protein n=1 Tax=Micromonospora sp. NPDC000207 TaxID=3154246 RepID=UPI0033177626